MKLMNQTEQRQEVHFVDGSCKQVKPKQTVNVKEKEIYADEMERIKKIFIIITKPVPQDDPQESYEEDPPTDKSKKAIGGK